jgi:hypothetical protein
MILTEFMDVLSGVCLQEQQIKLSIILIMLNSIGESSVTSPDLLTSFQVMRPM